MKGLKSTLALIAAAVAVQSAVAHVLYEDTFYWVPNGTAGGMGVDVFVNPAQPPPGAWVKIQETVYDDVQGRAVINNAVNVTQTAHGSPMPGPGPINVYVYSITNLTYGNSPVTPGGNGVSGFNIVNQFLAPNLGMWGSNAANDWWDVSAGNQPFPQNFEWDIDRNNNGFDGDGFGILQGQTYDSFMYAVPDGTPHGILPAWVHSWSGGGALEQPAAFQIDVTQGGFVSGPIPEPATLALLALGGLALIRRR